MKTYQEQRVEKAFERAYKCSRPWVEGSLHLKGIDITISLPQNVRVKDIEGSPETTFPSGASYVGGTVLPRYNTETKKWEFILDSYSNDGIIIPAHALFIRGHEEGHLCELTGNLQTLAEKARQVGLDFIFLTTEHAEKSDRENRFKLANNVSGNYVHYGCSEETADVAGLVALVNAGCDESLKRELMRLIADTSFFREVPDFWKKFYPQDSPPFSPTNH